MRVPTGPIRTLGIYGAGKSGVAIARTALRAGYEVRVATSGPPERTSLLAGIVTPGAVVVSSEVLPRQCDAVVLAVPLRRWRELPLDLLADRIVIDVMNYWPPVDGVLDAFEDDRRPSSEIVRDGLPPTAQLVKTFNHIGYHEIEDLARPKGASDRTAVAIAGDDDEAVDAVAHLADDLGFEPVLAGRLRDSAALQPGSPIFGAELDEHAMRSALGANSAPQPVLVPALTLLPDADAFGVCDLNGDCS